MGVGAQHRSRSAIQVPTESNFFRGRLRVNLNQSGVGAVGPHRFGQHRIGREKRAFPLHIHKRPPQHGEYRQSEISFFQYHMILSRG